MAARKITEDSVQAFLEGRDFRRANTVVKDGVLYLHNNAIARRGPHGIEISNAGWTSATTKERLNGLLDALGLPRIYQQNFEWIMREEPWSGDWTPVEHIQKLGEYMQQQQIDPRSEEGRLLYDQLTGLSEERWGPYTDYWRESGGTRVLDPEIGI